MARRSEIDHKELKGPDAFMEGVGSTLTYVRENRALVLGAIGAVVAVFAIGVYWNVSSEQKRETAAAAFMRATDALQSDNLTMAEAALKNVSENGIAPYDEMAALYSADILMRRASYTEAVAAYKEVAASGSTRYLRQIAMVGQAHALESQGQGAEALTAFEDAARVDGPYRETALRGQLRTAKASDANDKAVAAIEAILEKYPNAADADALSTELAALRG
jgi:predicted negative regulator of RcsB-dependent stress response